MWRFYSASATSLYTSVKRTLLVPDQRLTAWDISHRQNIQSQLVQSFSTLHLECFLESKMLRTKSSSLFYFICAHVKRVTELTQANKLRLRVSQRHQFLYSITHILCYASPESWRPNEKKEGNNKPLVYPCFLSVQIVWGGTWTIIPVENNTSFSPVKPSVRPHRREQALRTGDIISLPGKVAHSIFSATLHCGVVFWWQNREKVVEKKRSKFNCCSKIHDRCGQMAVFTPNKRFHSRKVNDLFNFICIDRLIYCSACILMHFK